MKKHEKLLKIKQAAKKPPAVNLTDEDHQILTRFGTSFDSFIKNPYPVIITKEKDTKALNDLLTRLDPIRQATTGSNIEFLIVKLGIKQTPGRE